MQKQTEINKWLFRSSERVTLVVLRATVKCTMKSTSTNCMIREPQSLSPWSVACVLRSS